MKFSFSKYELTDRATAVICTPDERPIGVLSNLASLDTEIYFNEISSISFKISDKVNGIKTPFYDDVVGMNIVDLRIGTKNLGLFILTEPEEINDGIHRIKTCKAYSLEYEMTYKKIFFEEGTYNFWNPVTPDSTVVGIILSYLPAWSLGDVDESLIGKYRTFSVDGENVYNFIKNTVQKTYHCIFDFDTYTKTINIKSANKDVRSAPVYLSSKNLAKEIKLTENSESLLTVLDVNGADGVTIRSVNPLGTNKIYNLDHFTERGYLPSDMIRKWNDWKSKFDEMRDRYYTISIQRVLKTSEIALLENQINTKKNTTIAILENERSIYVEYLASRSVASSDYTLYSQKLAEVNEQIRLQNNEITKLTEELNKLNQEKDTISESIKEINQAVAFSSFFDEDEIIILNRYFKEDSISDSSFVYTDVKSYDKNDLCNSIDTCDIVITSDEKATFEVDDVQHGYTVTGGTISIRVRGGDYFSGDIIHADVLFKKDSNVLLTAFVSMGAISGESIYPESCIVLSGTYSNASETGFTVNNAYVYITQSTTEYERYSVEKDLYEYGVTSLQKLASPSYTFDITSANFFMLDTFISFVNSIELGAKLYVELSEGNVIEPIFIGFGMSLGEPDSLKLYFSDTYTVSDKSFHIVDLLEQSISMGHSLDSNRFTYNSFIESGASSSVKEFMDSAIDASKNAIISGSNMAVSFDSSGIHARKWKEDGSGYEPNEIAIINNAIVFTDDGWNTAKMAIGRYYDPNVGETWGIVAPNITGTLLAGQNLVIESVKKDGDTAVFKVDADGAVLHNAKFDIDNGTSHIVLDPVLGFGIGSYPVVKEENGGFAWDESKAKFWIEPETGNVHIKGVVEAQDFIINGASVLTEDYKIAFNYLDLGNIKLNGKTGDIALTGNIDLSQASSITWGGNNPNTDTDTLPTYNNILSALKIANGLETTFITADAFGSPNIYGANIYGAKIYAGTSDSSYSVMDGSGFHVYSLNNGEGSFDITAPFAGINYHFLKIYPWDSGASPIVHFSSPALSDASWDFGSTSFNSVSAFYKAVYFCSDVEFRGSVSGLNVVFG